jgi:hypothetical protein
MLHLPIPTAAEREAVSDVDELRRRAAAMREYSEALLSLASQAQAAYVAYANQVARADLAHIRHAVRAPAPPDPKRARMDGFARDFAVSVQHALWARDTDMLSDSENDEHGPAEPAWHDRAVAM